MAPIQEGLCNSGITATIEPSHPLVNPPRHKKELHLQIYAREMAYIRPQEHETTQVFRKRVYRTLHEMERAADRNNELSIIRHWPKTNWENVWKKVHSSTLRHHKIGMV